MNTTLLRHLLSLVLFGLCSAASLRAQDSNANLESVFKVYLDDYFRLRPLEATRLGDHRFDSQLEDLTPAARAKWLELTRKTLAELPKKIDYSILSRPGQIDFEIFR